MTDPTPAEILALPLDPTEVGLPSVRAYLVAILQAVWREDVSGKAPLGHGGWRGDFDAAFIRAGWVAGRLDEDGDVDEVDSTAVDRLVRSAIQGLADGAA